MRSDIVLVLLIVACSTRAIKLPEKDPSNTLKWWQQDIIYQVYPRSLMDSDGDGTGDIKGIESKIDYFKDLGVGTLWLSPIYLSPMKDFGYDVANFTHIDPLFGTIDDFRSLSRSLKAANIKLVLDFIPNHSSDIHQWFTKSVAAEGQYKDYYVWRNASGFDDSGNPILPNNWKSVFGGPAWTWRPERQQFYLHQFLREQPDLNFENSMVLNEVLAAMKYWLDEGVDGFRMDAVPSMFEDQRFLDEPPNPNPPPGSIPSDHTYWLHIYTINVEGTWDALAEFRRLIDVYTLADGKERCMMVEAITPTMEILMKYYGTNEKPIAHFPFNFEFVLRVKKDFDGTDIASVIDGWLTLMPEGNTPNWLVGNHDNGRVGSRFRPEVIDAFNMLIMLLPGSVVTYYGEEIGMMNNNISWYDTVDPAGCEAGPERYQLFSRDPERTPTQWSDEPNAGFSTWRQTWLPVNPNYPDLNVDAQNNTSGESHLKLYKRINSLRKTPVWKYGALESRSVHNGAGFGYTRTLAGKGFIYLANFSPTEIIVNATEFFENVAANGKVYATSIDFCHHTPIGSSISNVAVKLCAFNAIVIEFQN